MSNQGAKACHEIAKIGNARDNRVMWILFAALLSISVNAQDRFQPIQIAAKHGDTIRISGVLGNLQLIHEPQRKNLSIQVDQRSSRTQGDWNLSMERMGSEIQIEVFSVGNMHQWKSDLNREQWPRYDIVIRGPSLPVLASWRQGFVQVVGWQDKIDLSLLNGKLSVRDSKAELSIQGAQLDFDLSQHQGKVRFVADKGDLRVASSQGDLDLQLMDGQVRIFDFLGQLKWNSERALFVSQRGGGAWQLTSQKGPVEISQFKGQLKGQGEKALWKVQVAELSEVDIRSNSGPVKLQWRKGAAKAFLSSQSGSINAPRSTRVRREQNGVSSWLSQWGEGQLGQIFVKTQTGSISLDQF